MNEMIELLERHHSIRRYSQQPVEETIVKRIIHCGQHAPSSSFLQAYSVIRVSDAEKREKLAKWSGDQRHVMEAPLFFVFCGDMHRLQRACEKQKVVMKQGMTEQLIIASVDAAIAAQNTLIAAESLGLGGVYVGGIRNHPREVSDLLKLPLQVFPVFGMALGYPAHSPQIKPRLPQKLVLMEENYRLEEELLDEYDSAYREYLANRTANNRDETWTRMISQKCMSELRPHMKQFLQEQGFALT